jgi:cytochrome c oxidase cbb3-type subunit 3
MENKRIDEPSGTEFVGHEWDGIEELDTPMPRWWLWTFYLCIIFSIGYVIVYPAIPLLNKGSEGLWGWTSRGQLASELAKAEQSHAEVRSRIAAVPLERLAGDPALMASAVAGGRAAFKVNCVQCHGSGAAGGAGYPNLNDDDWLWGGDLKAIETTIVHGIRQHGDTLTRDKQMPGFAGAWSQPQLGALTDHVLSLSGKANGNAAGAKLYAENCAACHGAAGQGDRAQGAPALNDAIWLYGGSRAEIQSQILKPKMGMMPSWQGRLDPVTIRMLAAYVHSLGGGEQFAEVAAEKTNDLAKPDEQR